MIPKIKMNVFVDLERKEPIGFYKARSVEEAIHCLQNYDVEKLSIDYYFGVDEQTGYDLCEEIMLLNIWPKEIYIHTLDSIGKDNMFNYLRRSAPRHIFLFNHPFGI